MKAAQDIVFKKWDSKGKRKMLALEIKIMIVEMKHEQVRKLLKSPRKYVKIQRWKTEEKKPKHSSTNGAETIRHMWEK